MVLKDAEMWLVVELEGKGRLFQTEYYEHKFR